MKDTSYKLIEFFIVFILTPISFTLDYSIWLKLAIGVFGFLYVVYVLLIVENNKFKIASHLNWKAFWRHSLLKLIVIAVLTTLFVYVTNKESLYHVLLNKPLKWIIILFVYSVFSVYPQELIFRTFYFQRFQPLFKSQNLFIFINAIVFSLAHLFFKSTLVIIITFLGGILFAITYSKTKSTLLVSIEHAIYGSWLFTVGMGEMLGFPS